MRGRCVHRKADVPILEHYASVVARVDANQGLDEVWAAIDKATDKATRLINNSSSEKKKSVAKA